MSWIEGDSALKMCPLFTQWGLLSGLVAQAVVSWFSSDRELIFPTTSIKERPLMFSED